MWVGELSCLMGHGIRDEAWPGTPPVLLIDHVIGRALISHSGYLCYDMYLFSTLPLQEDKI